MTFSDWLDTEAGRTTRLAEYFDVTVSAVTQWRTNGVPVNKLLEVKEFTRGQVTIEEMLEERAA